MEKQKVTVFNDRRDSTRRKESDGDNQNSQKIRGRRGKHQRMIERRKVVIPVGQNRRETERRVLKPIEKGTKTFGKRILSLGEIFKRIAIRDPYFALEDVTVYVDGTVGAKIPVQQPLGMEIPPISAAEAARHLAILGSCALGFVENQSDERHFYLASSGKMKRVTQNVGDFRYLYGTAKASFIGKRQAMAETEIRTDKGEVIYNIHVDYYVLNDKVFGRHYNAFKKDTRECKRDSACEGVNVIDKRKNLLKDKIPVYDMQFKDNQLSVSLGKVSLAQCMGHFPFYPAFPVALLMYQKFRSGGLLFSHLLGEDDITYVMKKASLESKNLAFVEDSVNIIATYIKSKEHDYMFSTATFTDKGKHIGNLDFTLSRRD